MHPNSQRIMQEKLAEHAYHPHELDVLDVGSYDVCGTYRPIVEDMGFRSYTGLDIEDGPNVDVVLDITGEIPAEHLRRYDVVISGQALEHVRQPWRFVEGCRDTLAPGGLLIVIAPWSFAVHKYPIDCWRVLPDGMQGLFDWVGIHMVDTDMSGTDTWAVGRNAKDPPATRQSR
jgi:SAM-dependent methyltransferase